MLRRTLKQNKILFTLVRLQGWQLSPVIAPFRAARTTREALTESVHHDLKIPACRLVYTSVWLAKGAIILVCFCVL